MRRLTHRARPCVPSGAPGCSTGSYRTYAWANDKFTNATEGGTAYKAITC